MTPFIFMLTAGLVWGGWAGVARAFGEPVDAFDTSSATVKNEDQAIAKKAVTRVVHISTAKGGICAGALVDVDLILTAWHCVNDVRPVDVSFRDSHVRYKGTVAAFDEDFDVAVLRLDRRPDLKPLVIKSHSGPIADATPIVVIGHPHDARYTVTAGKAIEPTVDFFLLNAKVDRGNSGGPIFDRVGEVVGVVIILNKFVGGRELGEAVALKPIHDVLNAAKKQQDVSWSEADGSGYFDFAYGNDKLLNDLTAPNFGTFVYAVGWDYYDRWRVGFRHFTMRHERVWGYETGPVFKSLWGDPALLFGRNYYFPDGANVIANKFGVAFELLFLDVTYFRVQHAGQAYSAFTIGF